MVTRFGKAVRFRLALAALLAAWLFGGASRFDVIAPFIASATALVAIAILWATRRIGPLSKGEIVCWGLTLAIFAVQMIPLPPIIWQALPGHAFPRDFFPLVGDLPWLPISLTPSRTLASLFAIFPPLAVYLASRGLSREEGDRLLTWLVGFALASAILGIFQVAGGSATSLRPYSITNRDAAVGFFSNANHFGVWVASCIPIAAYLALRYVNDEMRVPRTTVLLIASGVIALLATGAVASFSRAAYGATLLALFISGSALIVRSHLSRTAKVAVGVVASLIFAAATVWVTSSGALERIAEVSDMGGRGRLQMVPVFAQIVADTMPIGTGMGSFDNVHRGYEDYTALGGTYLNNAHNDLAQILIEAGLLGAACLAAWLLFIGRHAVSRLSAAKGNHQDLGVLRAIVLIFPIIILLGHSLVDYPLRGSAAAATFVLCVALLVAAGQKTK